MPTSMGSYPIEKLRLAALKLGGRGTPSERFTLAQSDLSAVFESDVPERLRPVFRALKDAIKDRAGDREAIALRLNELASSLRESSEE